MKRTALFLLALTVCSAALSAGKTKSESIALKSARKTVLQVKVDGAPVKVTWFADNYLTRPNRPEDQKINIYVPETATKASPIVLYVNNAGWQANGYPENTLADGQDYDGSGNKVGVALKEGYVVVSYGGRSRSNGLTDGRYLGHSPAIMADTKAVIRYLRFNKKALPAGDTDKIIVTGTSGGGALSTVIAASGNSPDFFEELYEIGAAGIIKAKDGSLSSAPGIGDNVLGVIAYCPITDLGHSCYGYEWLFGHTRKALYLAGEMDYSYAPEATILEASDALAALYVPYLNSLGLKDEFGNPVTDSNLRDQITRLMKEEIEKTLAEIGPEQMKADVEQEIRTRGFGGPGMGGPRGQMRPGGELRPGGNGGPQAGGNQAVQHRKNNGWITFSEDGSYRYDLDKHLYYLAKYTALKVAPSFSNIGLYDNRMNEDNLFGTREQEYAPFNAWSWNHDTRRNSVGLDDTGLTWEQYLRTADGQALLKQIKMTCAMDYILENKADVAPYWYVRHGMDDRDNSFAVETTLFLSVRSSPAVKAHNVGFAWLKPHSGDYDVPEAYSWLKEVLGR
ncbi:MAG: hypothetical protein IJ651_01595 [Bacteroidales bacterium]|nr:hypothetical protein [Bacteroidales bacterium]